MTVSNSGYSGYKGCSEAILSRKRSQKEGLERVWLVCMEENMEVKGPYPLPLTKWNMDPPGRMVLSAMVRPYFACLPSIFILLI